MIPLLVGYEWLFIHRPFEVWPVLGPLRLERLYIGLCIVKWLTYPGKTWARNRLTVAFACFWGAFILAWMTSSYQDNLKLQSTVEDYLKVAVFYFLVMASVKDEKDLKALVIGCIASFGLYMTHSLLEFKNGRHVYRMGIPRLIGVDNSFGDPNTFASSIVYALALSLCLWPEIKQRKHLLLLLYYSGLTVLCVILTGSRSGMVGMLCLGLLCLPRLWRKKIFLVVLAGAIPLAWVAMPPDLQNRFWTLIDPSFGPENARESAEGRSQGLFDGIALWEKNPVFGVGPGAFGAAVGHGMQAHNLYGQTLGEMGSLGAITMLGVLLCFFWNEVEIRRLGRTDVSAGGRFPVNLSGAVLVAVVLLLIKGNADHNLFRYNWVWFGAFQAIAVHCMRQRRDRGSAQSLVPDDAALATTLRKERRAPGLTQRVLELGLTG